MSRGPVAVWFWASPGRLALAATAVAMTAVADGGQMTDAAAQLSPVDSSRFEAFARAVGINLAEVPVPVRREWTSAPRLGLDDCGGPGADAKHHQDADSDEAGQHGGAVGTQPGGGDCKGCSDGGSDPWPAARH